MKALLRVKTLVLIFIGITTMVATADTSFGQSLNPNGANPNPHRHHRHMRGFRMGLCVGQTLATAQPPIILPITPRGQKRTPPDAQTRAAIKAARNSCRAQFRGGAPANS